MNEKAKKEAVVEEAELVPGLGHLQEWGRLIACHTRKNSPGLERCRQNLKAKGESEERLNQIAQWPESAAYTEREKAAFRLSESMSSGQSDELPPRVLKATRRHFSREEMVQLTLAVLDMNDWINRHPGSRVRVLVVEDDPLDRELLHRQLQKVQVDENVIFASDARQALAVIDGYRTGERDGELIAIFLDLHLPGMNGLEFLRIIRSTQDTEDMPVIVMTGSRDPNDFEQCQKLKVLSYLEKPITFGRFSKAVASIFFDASLP